MNELPLFEPRSAEGDSTWSVVELNEAISTALQERFPQEIWVRGEIQGLSRTRMRKHWYFELVEKESFGEGVKGRLSVALLSWNRASVDRIVASTPGFDLDDGIEVRIKGRVDFYPPFGKLQLAMTGIDPAFTLGQLALQRERVLAALKQEGLLRSNAEHLMPLVPERIGLVTSVGSAAYNDFVNELEQGGFGHRLEVVDARVQGADAEPTLLAALRTLARRRCDVVAICRGGGSQSDLAAFDGEALARRIAQMPMPVITGIGHEIDTSVADLVAHTSFKTPTACAAYLVNRTQEYLDRIESSWTAIAEYAGDLVREESHSLVVSAHRVASRAGSHLLAGERQLVEAGRRVGREAPRSLVRRVERLGTVTRRIAQLPPRSLEREAESLSGHELRVRALDPARVLARGYSLSYDAKGSLLRDASQLKEDQEILTRLAKGSVRSRIASILEENESK